MMMVPEAANMPPTPWQTEIFAPEIWAGAVPRIWRTLSCKAYGVHAVMDVGKTATIGVERRLAAGSDVALCNEDAGFAARHEAEVLEAVDRQVREGVVGHQMRPGRRSCS
jgi:hypothetical protein